jgi:hypothetical protein
MKYSIMFGYCSSRRFAKYLFYERDDFVKSILEAFAYGNINPDEGSIKKGSRYANIIKTVSDCEDKLLSMLDGEPKELLIKFSSAQTEANSISNVDKFICGYRLGVLMTREVFTGREDAIFGGEGFE